MSVTSPQYVEFIVERLAEISGVRSARFFGGIGLSANSTQFAMIMGSTLYFVVDKLTRPKYEQMGSGCFAYDTKNGRVQVKKYFQVPAEVIEEQDTLVSLARQAIQVAHNSKKRSEKSGA